MNQKEKQFAFWKDKLKQYQQFKQSKRIETLLHLGYTNLPPRKLQKRPLSQLTTQGQTLTSRSTNRFNSPTDRFTSPKSTRTSPKLSRQNTPTKISSFTRNNSPTMRTKSPLDVICPFNTQTPIEALMGKQSISDVERLAFQNFLFSSWVNNVIQKKSLMIEKTQNTQADKIKIFSRMQQQLNYKIRYQLTKQKRILIRIKVFYRLALQKETTLRQQIKKFQETTTLLIFLMHLKNDQYQTCENLLKQDSSLINTPNHQGDRPIHVCIRRSNIKQLKFIIQCKPDLEAINFMGQTPLQLALQLNHHGVIKILLVGGCWPYERITNPLIRIAIENTIRLIQVSIYKSNKEFMTKWNHI
ncbi:SMC5-SMC6 complex localization factor protein 1 [Paramecium bursaria]